MLPVSNVIYHHLHVPPFYTFKIRIFFSLVTVYDLKKIKTTIDNMVLEKQKLEKGDKPKKSKGKGKAKLKIEGDSVSIFNYITQCE